MAVWPALQATVTATFSALRGVVNEFYALWQSITGGMSTDWAAVGQVVGVVVGTLVNGALKFLLIHINMIRYFVADLRQLFLDFTSGNVVTGLKRLGNIMLSALLFPIRQVAAAIATLMNAALDVPGAATALGEDRFAQAKAAAGKISGFAEQGVKIFDVPEAAGAGDIVGTAGQQVGKRAIQDVELDREAYMRDSMATAVVDVGAEMQKAVEAGMANTNIENTMNTNVNIDGKTVARNQAKQQQDLADRLGAQTPPFVRRVRADQGTLPAQ
jgi:hypothetical protein